MVFLWVVVEPPYYNSDDYIITDLKFPVNVKVDYYPQTYGNRNVTLWGIY